jgi:twitching motility two-component system response regulator PilH
MPYDHSQPAPCVLVVEDDPEIAELLRTLLKPGRQVEISADGFDALRQIRTSEPDVIVLDLMLPRLNGFEVVRELAALAPEKLERVIVLTAASEATLRSFTEKRVYRVIKKPFDIDEMTHAVDACAAQARAGVH